MVRIIEHKCDYPVKSLEVVVLLSKEADVRKFGRLQQKEHNIFFFPDMPLGIHTSVHDVEKNHPMATIHAKIPSDKGVFQVFPDGEQIGRTIELKYIPPFDQIKDVIPVYPGRSWISLDTIWQQSPKFEVAKISGKQKICVDLGSFVGNFMGFQILLVGKGNMLAVSRWCKDEINRVRMGSLEIKSVDMFKVFVPWLAIVVEDYQSHI